MRRHKNSWIYLTSTYYWRLLRPTITIRFDSNFQIIAQLFDLIRFKMKKHYSHITSLSNKGSKLSNPQVRNSGQQQTSIKTDHDFSNYNISEFPTVVFLTSLHMVPCRGGISSSGLVVNSTLLLLNFIVEFPKSRQGRRLTVWYSKIKRGPQVQKYI